MSHKIVKIDTRSEASASSLFGQANVEDTSQNSNKQIGAQMSTFLSDNNYLLPLYHSSTN
jgi:hypothetical protein